MSSNNRSVVETSNTNRYEENPLHTSARISIRRYAQIASLLGIISAKYQNTGGTVKKPGYTFLVVGALLLAMGVLPFVGVQDAFAQATTATLNPTKDNSLFSEGGSNGAGDFLFIGRTSGRGGGATRRTLLAFDVAGAVPAGATITGAALTLNMSRTTAGAQAATLHNILADWGEGTSNAVQQEGRGTGATTGDATWTQRFSSGEAWQAQGGDFEATVSATVTVGGGGTYTWTSAEMIADVQSWLDDPDTSFGWLIRGNESATQTAKRFDSKDNGTLANRPVLEITYEVAAQAEPTPEPTEVPEPTATAVPPTTDPATTEAPEPVLISEPTPPVTGDVQVPGIVLMGLSVLGAIFLLSGGLILRPRRREK